MTVSAEEKKRILRERRQAKMAAGKASGRLNDILSLGSSVKENSAVSVLDKEVETPIEHDDPEIQDISTVEDARAPEDMEKMFQNMFANSNAQGSGDQDQFSQMMMNMMSGQGAGGSPFGDIDPNAPNPFEINPEQAKYETDLIAYNAYEQRKWKFRFLVIRYVATLTNFFYHFVNFSTFTASSHSYIRGLASDSSRFAIYFLTIEVAILSSFYLVSLDKNLLLNNSEKSYIMKGLGFGSMVLPQLASYKPLVGRLLGYYEIFGMFLGDLALVIVLFGIFSNK